MKPITLAILATLAATGPAAAAETAAPYRGLVVAISDGDTLTVLDDGKQQHRVRLHGIDAPERGQPFGTRARQQLAALASQRTVAVVPIGPPDRYGRTVARVTVDDRDIGTQLLDSGLAWHWTQYDRSAAYAQAQRDAQAAHRGLWSDPHPIPPWQWRKMPKSKRPAATAADR